MFLLRHPLLSTAGDRDLIQAADSAFKQGQEP